MLQVLQKKIRKNVWFKRWYDYTIMALYKLYFE